MESRLTRDEIDLLRAVIESGKTIRPLGDVVPAKGLQSAQMATLTYLDEGGRISVQPTQTGRRWYALAKDQKRDKALQVDDRARRLMQSP